MEINVPLSDAPLNSPFTYEDYAGFWVRFFAACIDMIVYTPFYIGLRYLLGPTYQWQAETIFAIFALVTYAWFFASKWQGSPGMHILKFHICGAGGERIGFWHALIWGVTSMAGWMVCFAGVLYLQARFDVNAVNQLSFSCVQENIAPEDCNAEIQQIIGIPYSVFASMMLAASGLALFLCLIWALSIALPKDKTGFHNLLCRTRFVKGRPL